MSFNNDEQFVTTDTNLSIFHPQMITIRKGYYNSQLSFNALTTITYLQKLCKTPKFVFLGALKFKPQLYYYSASPRNLTLLRTV